MGSNVINIDPNTLQTQQTTFDGSVAPLVGAGPLQPGQQYAYPGMSPGDINTYLSNVSGGQISTWFQQAQSMIEQNPGLAALVGLGVLIMAANSGNKGRR